ncbi:hypothetical protein FS837_000763 [Tulasnella sp. UAMH 9824]|nr:hypothetical protein FS837_000763 [Tulasnella sp. UAMH 9824]
MGWDEEDFPNSNKEFRDLVWKDQKLTPKIWQNIRPRLERLLETGRNERLAIEKLQRLSNRKKAIIRLYHRLCRDVMDLPFDHSHLNHLHPDAAGIYALPSIKTLLENDTETFTEEQLIEVAPDARLMVLKWWRDCLKQLLEYAVGGKTSPSNQPDAGAQEVVGPESDTEDAISGSIEVLRATLTRGTSGGIWSFPEIIRHGLSVHFTFSIETLLSRLQQPQPEQRELAERLLTDLSSDLEGARISQLTVDGRNEKKPFVH